MKTLLLRLLVIWIALGTLEVEYMDKTGSWESYTMEYRLFAPSRKALVEKIEELQPHVWFFEDETVIKWEIGKIETEPYND